VSDETLSSLRPKDKAEAGAEEDASLGRDSLQASKMSALSPEKDLLRCRKAWAWAPACYGADRAGKGTRHPKVR
jgi:hypothetical protein